MGFFKEQQVKAARRLLAWQYTKAKQPLPAPADLEAQARQLVDDAQRIAHERGGNVLTILKGMLNDVRRR